MLLIIFELLLFFFKYYGILIYSLICDLDNSLSITPFRKKMIKYVPRKNKKTVTFSELPVTGYDQELSSVTPQAVKIEASTSVTNVSANDTHRVI